MQCLECGKELRSDNKTGYCVKHRNKSATIKQYKQKHHIDNKDHDNQRNNQYYIQNKDKIQQQYKETYVKYSIEQICIVCGSKFTSIRPNHIKCSKACRKAFSNEYFRNKYKNDELHRLAQLIRCRIYQSLKLGRLSKIMQTRDYLKCSYEVFLKHLGPKLNDALDLDHICPCHQAQNEEELIKLQHYSNFRWLDSSDNISKSDNKTPEAEEMCHKLLGREWID